MAKFEEVLAPGITIRESANDGSDFTNPAADYRRLFLGEDGQLHLRDSAGTITDIGGGSGAVAADAIWDAKGDLAGGTGANTAAKLTVGANDTILMADSAQSTGLKWVASQTPSTQAFGDAAAEGTADTYARGDHKHAMPATPKTVANDTIWDAAGDLAVGSGADTAARLAIGATNGMVLMRVGGAVAWAFPPGHQFGYTEITTAANAITATTEGAANTVITASGIAYDGSTEIWVEFGASDIISGTTFIILVLYDDTGGGAASTGRMAIHSGSSERGPMTSKWKVTPSAATHTYSMRAYVDAGTGTVNAGASGSGAYKPAFIRQFKA